MNKKLVLEEKDGTVFAGIAQKDCDPVFASFKGTLADLLMEEHSPGVPVLSGFVAIAETKWTADPKATKYTNPALAAEAQVKKAAKKANEKAAKKAKAEAKAGTPQLPLLDDVKEAPAETGENSVPPDKDIDETATSTFTRVPGKDVDVEVNTTGEVEKEAEDASAPVHVATSTDAPCPACQTDEKLPCNSPGFYLQDGSGPFADIQLAMDALGMPKDKRPTHKRYGRLSKDLQAQIIDKTVANGK